MRANDAILSADCVPPMFVGPRTFDRQTFRTLLLANYVVTEAEHADLRYTAIQAEHASRSFYTWIYPVLSITFIIAPLSRGF
jgi:hypothetical protein